MTAAVLIDQAILGDRLRAVREAADVSQEEAGAVIGVSPPTYSRIETGARPLKGDELVVLADRFGVRVGAITGVATLRDRVRYAARTDGAQPQLVAMRAKLHAYLELDSYLTDQGVGPVHWTAALTRRVGATPRAAPAPSGPSATRRSASALVRGRTRSALVPAWGGRAFRSGAPIGPDERRLLDLPPGGPGSPAG